MDVWMSVCVCVRMCVCLDQWMDGWMDGLMSDAWMDVKACDPRSCLQRCWILRAEYLSYFQGLLLLRYRIPSCTCTDSWCYLTRPSIDRWCKATRRCKIFSPTSIDALCHGTRSSLVLAKTLDIPLQDLLLDMRRHLMVSERLFSGTCTDTWRYINRSSLVLAHLPKRLGLHEKIFPRTSTDTWCYVTGCYVLGSAWGTIPLEG